MQWEWDEAKFQLKTPLRELSESISMRIAALDDELKLKMSELNALKGVLQGIERKTQGNLMVRGMADLVSEEDVMESEYMTTVYVVVPKANMKEFETGFEKMATYVVPRSAKLLGEDTEYGLYGVVLFKKSVDEFKASAREKRFTMREFTYDPQAVDNDRVKKATDEAEFSRLKGMLTNWCLINYSECYIMMLHLKAVRVFCESVLRYGLSPGFGGGMSPNFKAFLLHPKKGVGEKLRKVLAGLYSGNAEMIGDAEEETVIPGATGEFYPYVYTAIETEPATQAA
jgi:V-type H+-transporting ATPase subunit C